MQNLIVLCQRCISWVEPLSERCPECGDEVVLERPDPDPDALATVVGMPLMLLGTVRVERQSLPSYGELIGTDEGLLFLPQLNRRLNGAWEEVSTSRTSRWWPFRGDINSPRFLDWLRRPSSVKPGTESPTSQALAPQRTSLADRLMESPGAFFARNGTIHSITTPRRNSVKVDRSPLRSVTFTDATENGTLKSSLDALTLMLKNG